MNASNPMQIALAILPNFTMLDIIGPLQTLSPLSRIDHLQAVVVAENTDVSYRPTPSSSCPKPHSSTRRPIVIVVPGGGQPTLAACGNQRLIDYVSTAASNAEIVMSVCTGALILASAACSTTGRPRIGLRLILSKASAPSTSTNGGPKTGKYLTTAGVSAGIDGSLYSASRGSSETTQPSSSNGHSIRTQPPFDPIDWDPAIGRSATTHLAWGALPDVPAAHPYLARETVSRRDPPPRGSRFATTQNPGTTKPDLCDLLVRPFEWRTVQAARRVGIDLSPAFVPPTGRSGAAHHPGAAPRRRCGVQRPAVYSEMYNCSRGRWPTLRSGRVGGGCRHP